MSPVVKPKREKFTLSGKSLLLILTIASVLLMLVTYGTTAFDGPFHSAVGAVIVPFEKGIGRVGEWLGNRREELERVTSLIEENRELREQVEALTEENTRLTQERYELNELRSLQSLSDEYEAYHKVGARIIASDGGNWFHSFVIDKGTNDGLEIDMNVIADGGLVGRISSIGPNWARVTSVISDGTHVSGQVLSTGDTLIVSGSLELYAEGLAEFSQLTDDEELAQVGDKIVTSQISDKFLPGLLIGYIQTIRQDNNNLTRSGYLIPAVDFSHLSVVLVITDRKNTDYDS
ncbi:MAG: rod shape-determining protein MreC [Lachnospiraceae bacterium]|nr:rod shape-determining protein MreC [Lachnospiraceae bacterium]